MATFWLRTPDTHEIFQPLPHQHEFFLELSKPEKKFIGLLGGVGCGKTLTGCVAILLMMLTNPGGRYASTRLHYPDLLRTTWATLIAITPKELILSLTESQQNMQLTLVNGSICYGLTRSNWRALTSFNLDGFHADEITEDPDNKSYLELCKRLRGKKGPRKAVCTGTPNGLDWVFDLFVKEKRADHAYVRARTKDNPHNPWDYEGSVHRIMSPQERAQFLEGEFLSFTGPVLHNWRETVHVLDPFNPPTHWPRFRAIDPGYAQDPACCLWATTDAPGNLYVIDEYYERGRIIREQAESILAMSMNQRIEWSVIDPSAARRNNESGKSEFDLYAEHGIANLIPGDNRLDPSIHVLQDLLWNDPDRLHPETGQPGAPRLYVTRNCHNLRDEIRRWKWERNGKPGERDDHAIAALRYLVMQRPRPAGPAESLVPDALWEQFWAGVGEEATSGLPFIGNERAAA